LKTTTSTYTQVPPTGLPPDKSRVEIEKCFIIKFYKSSMTLNCH